MLFDDLRLLQILIENLQDQKKEDTWDNKANLIFQNRGVSLKTLGRINISPPPAFNHIHLNNRLL